ncbi:MAG: hypothetical protein HQL50_09170 [Magnetococcales bacterium]|nr:hypothetical protein [Magnetococcales bacterium]
MSIKIHHGAPGAFKTSGAIADDLKEPVYAGRLVITNIRGLHEDRVRQVFSDQFKTLVPEEWRLISLDSDSDEDRKRLATFFHWAPDGAFFIVDEVGEIWDPSITPKQLEQFDYPGGVEQAEKDNRFHRLSTAFRMHRHRQWDFVFTAQDISQVHRVVRECCELAFYHKNLDKLGMSGYVEGMHSARTSGLSPSHYQSKKRKSVPKWAFDVYQSTMTGEVTNAGFGTSIFKQAGFLFPLLVLVFAGYTVVSYLLDDSKGSGLFVEKSVSTVPKGYGKDSAAGAAVGSGDAVGAAGHAVSSRRPASLTGKQTGSVEPEEEKKPKTPLDHPLSESEEIYWMPRWRAQNHYEYIVRKGVLTNYADEGGIVFVTAEGRVSLRERELIRIGVFMDRVGPCIVRLRHRSGWKRLTFCEPEPEREPEKKQRPQLVQAGYQQSSPVNRPYGNHQAKPWGRSASQSNSNGYGMNAGFTPNQGFNPSFQHGGNAWPPRGSP